MNTVITIVRVRAASERRLPLTSRTHQYLVVGVIIVRTTVIVVIVVICVIVLVIVLIVSLITNTIIAGTPLRSIFKLRIYDFEFRVKQTLKRRRWIFLAHRLISERGDFVRFGLKDYWSDNS